MQRRYRLARGLTLGLTLGAVCLFLSSVAARADWSTYHGNSQRTGYTDAIGPVAPSLKWAIDLKGPIITSPVVGPDGTIYLGSVWRDTLHPAAYIYAINPDGTPKWRFPTRFVEDQSISTPALGPGGEVYVGAADGAFYALDSNGALLWVYQAELPIVSHPVVAPDGTIYVHLDTQLTAFLPDGTIEWQYPVGNNFSAGPTLDRDGTIYTVANSSVIAVHPNGTLKWDSGVLGTIGLPVVSPNGDVIVSAFGTSALDPATGAVKWQHPEGGGNYGAPAVDPSGNIFYAVSWDMFRFSPAGNLIWHEEFLDGGRLGSTYGSVIVDGAGHLFLGMGTGKRWAIELEKNIFVYNRDGVRIGSYALPEVASTSSVALGDDGTLYVGCLDGKLYALE